uniref:craniofacial development protein 2-like n=1 Tax=Saccostrea cuccullata TaxID=36930 RepID=UPI002ED1E406
MTAQFYSRYRRVSVIQAYAPHNEKEEEEKTNSIRSHERLWMDVIRTTYQLIIIMGDLNAKVGSDNNGYERTMGIHGLGTQDENGERLCEFSQTSKLVITGTLFPHKNLHESTWVSVTGTAKIQIDHLLISGQ